MRRNQTININENTTVSVAERKKLQKPMYTELKKTVPVLILKAAPFGAKCTLEIEKQQFRIREDIQCSAKAD